jgi:lipopolysaccharide export system protein LptA
MRRICLTILLLAASLPAHAQGVTPGTDKTQPLEITADQTLEWHRNDKQFIARGNAAAKQGAVSIAAQTLTADYRESAKSSMDIYRLRAAGGVTIDSQGNRATGDKAEYDVDSGHAVMTGGDLRLTSPDQTVTAQERFEYDVTQGRLSAHGDAVVVRGQDRLAADTVSAQFLDDPATGKRTLRELTADGHVVITTPTETVHGAHGVYHADTNIATLSGGVRIERGPNVLEGSEAEVDLNSNVSRMIGGTEQSGGRVRGVFYPGSDKPPALQPAPQIMPQATPQTEPQPPAAPMPSAPVPLTPPAALTRP